jgi:hypothetical protein
MINPRKLKIIGLVSHREILANGENGTLGENVAVHSRKICEMVRQAKMFFFVLSRNIRGWENQSWRKKCFLY